MSNRSFRRLKLVFLCMTAIAVAATVGLGYAWLDRTVGGPPVSPWWAALSALTALLGV